MAISILMKPSLNTQNGSNIQILQHKCEWAETADSKQLFRWSDLFKALTEQ